MSKEKLSRLIKYSDALKSKQQDPRTEKQKKRLEQYNRYLANEIATVSAQIEGLKMTVTK